MGNRKKFSKKTFLHFIPFLITQTEHSVCIYNLSFEGKLKLFNTFREILVYGKWPNGEYSNWIYASLIILAYNLLYAFFTYKCLNNNFNKVVVNLSNMEKVNLKFLKNLITIMATLALINFIFMLVYVIFRFEFLNLSFAFIGTCLTILTFILGYVELNRTKELSHFDSNTCINDGKLNKHDKSVSEFKYGDMKLDDSKMSRYLEKLENYIKKEKPYLDPGITLQKLSDGINIPPYLISQIINSGLNKNFFTFINELRIEDVK